MAGYTKYKNLEKPLSTEKYNVGVANKNSDVIDSELHKLDLKNESQDALLATKESLIQHTDNTENPHNVTKSQVGLDNVDNTADMDKPVSAAQREAINDIYTQTNSYVDIKIADLIDGAPETLNTLKKLADAIGENPEGIKGQILKTIEEVETNTDEDNLVSAVVIGELINDLNQLPEFIYDTTGKIIGYRTKEGADTEFPFNDLNDAGYSLNPLCYLLTYYTIGSSSYALFPLNGIKSISFTYGKTWYASIYAILEGPTTRRVIISDETRGEYNSSINVDFEGIEYSYIRFEVGVTGQSFAAFGVSNFVASA